MNDSQWWRSLPLSTPATVWLSADKDSLSHLPPTALNKITPLTSVISGTAGKCVVDFQVFGCTGSPCNQVASQYGQMQLSLFVSRHLTWRLSMFFCHAPLSPHLPFSFYHLFRGIISCLPASHTCNQSDNHSPVCQIVVSVFLCVCICLFSASCFKVYSWLLSAFESHQTSDSFGVGQTFKSNVNIFTWLSTNSSILTLTHALNKMQSRRRIW